MPVPARDGSWVIDGWSATRFEPGTRTCDDLDVTRAAGALLHAEFAQAFSAWEPADQPARHRWDEAHRLAFGERAEVPDGGTDDLCSWVDLLERQRDSTPIGVPQLVHGDLAGNVLLDEAGAPVVIDVSPYWAPALWAEAVCVLDMVLWHGADAVHMQRWCGGAHRQAMLRAALFRLSADRPDDVGPYRAALSGVIDRSLG